VDGSQRSSCPARAPLVEVRQAYAGLCPAHAAAYPAQAVIAAQIQDHAAMKRRALAVVAGAAAAQRDGHAPARAMGHDLGNLGLGARTHRNVAALALQGLLQNRAEPGKSWDRRDTFRESVIQSSAGKALASWLLFSAIGLVFMVVAQKCKA
jgi:hypothetical protein